MNVKRCVPKRPAQGLCCPTWCAPIPALGGKVASWSEWWSRTAKAATLGLPCWPKWQPPSWAGCERSDLSARSRSLLWTPCGWQPLSWQRPLEGRTRWKWKKEQLEKWNGGPLVRRRVGIGAALWMAQTLTDDCISSWQDTVHHAIKEDAVGEEGSHDLTH